MKKVSKPALLISTALLWWIGDTHPTFSMDEPKKVDLKSLTIPTLPVSAKTSKDTFFQYLNSLKDGENDTLIEDAKLAYQNEPATPHFKKMQAALNRLAIGHTTKELTKEEREQRERTEQEHKKVKEELNQSKQHIQKVEEEKDIAQEAFGRLQFFRGMGEAQQFLEMFKEAMSGFSDGLFLLKFKGDLEPEFEKTLTKIAKQAEASAKMKQDYEQDKRIKKLDIFLQLPSNPTDLDSINHGFKREQEILLRNLIKKIGEFRDLIEQVKKNFELISKKSAELNATQEDVEYFEKYWLTDEKVENEAYTEIFQSAGDLIKFYGNLIVLLKENYARPIDFKKKYELLLEQNKGILSEDFSRIIGGEALKGKLPMSDTVLKTEDTKFLLMSISGLSLYHYLKLRKDQVSDKLETYITSLMRDIKKMRIDAYQLKAQIGTPQEVFMKLEENEPELTLEPKIMREILNYINQYEKGMGENALQKNIRKFLSEDKHGYTDFNKMKRFKDENTKLENEILGSMKQSTISWEKSFKAKNDFYNSKALRGIFASNLYVNKDKDRLLVSISDAGEERVKKSAALGDYDKYLSSLVKTKFRRLEVDAKKIDLKLLFDEPLSVKEARRKRNEQKEEENRKIKEEKDKKPLEVAPPITIEVSNLGTLMRIFISNSHNPTFESFWELELRNDGSDINKFMKALSKPESKDHVKNICERAFEFLKSNTEEQKQLYNLFDQVIKAKGHHDDFIKKMKIVKEAFEPLKGAPKHAKLEVQKKVKQLEDLLEHNPDVYLKMDADERASNYAYNFQMFYKEALKPLDKDDNRMKVWGGTDDTEFDKALGEAYEAYVEARDAIRAINPTATQDSIGALRLGGFYEEGGYQIHQLAQSFEIIPIMDQHPQGELPMRRGGPPPRGGMQPQNALRGGGLRGAGGLHQRPAQRIPEEDQIKTLCNECSLIIAKVLSESEATIDSMLSKMFAETYKTFLEAPREEGVRKNRESEVEEIKKGKKPSILESVKSKVTEDILDQVVNSLIDAFEYKYIDIGRPEIEKILDTIRISCGEEKIKATFGKIFEEEMRALALKEKKNATMLENRKEEKAGGVEGVQQGKLRVPNREQKEESQEKEGNNPFGKKLKSRKINAEDEALNLEQAENKVFKIQESDHPDKDKESLVLIKKALSAAGKDPNVYTDEQLLAFHMDLLAEIKPDDIQDFTEDELIALRKTRFNNFSHSYGSFLTIDTKLLEAYETSNTKGYGNKVPNVDGATYPTVSEALQKFKHDEMFTCLSKGKCAFNLKIDK